MKKHRIAPPMLADIIQAALSVCDNKLFDQCSSCPKCEGPVSGYDIKRKQFAVIMDREQERSIEVRVKRYSCLRCKSVFFADQPFYPHTRVGSPVFDLCSAFSATMPYFQVASTLRQLGVIVDRWSVRNYAMKDYQTSTINVFGVMLPSSILSLSALEAGSADGLDIPATDILAACNFPSRKRPAFTHEE